MINQHRIIANFFIIAQTPQGVWALLISGTSGTRRPCLISSYVSGQFSENTSVRFQVYPWETHLYGFRSILRKHARTFIFRTSLGKHICRLSKRGAQNLLPVGRCLKTGRAMAHTVWILLDWLIASISSFRDNILLSRSDTILAHSTSSLLICSGASPSNL